MRSKTIRILSGLVLLTFVGSACSAIARHHGRVSQQQTSQTETDPISGEWDVSFFVNGSTTPAKFTLKVEGNKVTGTAYSDHTGEGTVRDGSWKDGKLNFTLDFKKHESIAVDGGLKDGKLAGEFHTEGFTSKWEATRK
ncbi:MAG TPA: hypothetical protein VLL54_06855 [Pyrinomonadaceae bacterium]|nr:hypothetical protein [Pyrinomonadaceae bacterium]